MFDMEIILLCNIFTSETKKTQVIDQIIQVFVQKKLLIIEQKMQVMDQKKALKKPSETPGAILFVKPMQSCVILNVTRQRTQI